MLEVLVFPVARQWSALSLTWFRQPGGSGGPAAGSVLRPEHNGMTRIDITNLVTSWMSRSVPNRGILLRAQPERSGSRVAWYSNEATDIAHRPVLEVQVQ